MKKGIVAWALVTVVLMASMLPIYAASESVRKGVDLYKKGDLAGAATELEKAVQNDPKDAMAQSWLGFILLKQNSAAEAVDHLQRASELAPKDAEVWNNLGTAYLEIGENEKAVTAYSEAIKLSPTSTGTRADVLYNLANAHLRLKHGAEAEKYFRQALTVRPNDPNITNNLALSLQQQGKNDEAISTFRSALEVSKDDPTLLLNLGLAQKANNDMAGARQTLEQAVTVKKDFYNAQMALGEILAGGGDDQLDEAVGCYKAASELQPKQFEPFYNLGVLYARQGKHQAAVEALNAALKIKPNDLDATSNLGWSLYKSGHTAEGIKQLKIVEDRSPDYSTARRRLATIYTQEKDAATDAEAKQNYRASALAEWSEVARIEPKDTAAHVNLANLYLETRDFDKAERHYRAAIATDADNPQACLGLGLVLVEQGKLDKAIEQYRSLIKSHPKLASAYNNLGVAFEKNGNADEAKAQYKKALELDPNYEDAKYNLDRLTQR